MRIKLTTNLGRDIEDIRHISIDGVDYHFNNCFYYPALLTPIDEENESFSLEGDLEDVTIYDLRWHHAFLSILEAMPEAKDILAKARLQIGDLITQKEQELREHQREINNKIQRIKIEHARK